MPVLASLLHDGDVLIYWLYRGLECLDSYNSAPGYFDASAAPGPPTGGDAEALCAAFGAVSTVEEVAELLHSDDSSAEVDYLSAEDRHGELVELLGFPRFAAGVGYDVIVNGTPPAELDIAALVKTA